MQESLDARRAEPAPELDTLPSSTSTHRARGHALNASNNASRPLVLPMSSAEARRSRRSTLISHPTLLGERWMPTPGWEHLQGHCLDETLSFVNPALTTGRNHHCGRPRQAARATYCLRAHALLRRDGPCARSIPGVGRGLNQVTATFLAGAKRRSRTRFGAH